MNVAADFYKAGAKVAGAGLVKTGPYKFAIRLNYFGELFREGHNLGSGALGSRALFSNH